MLIDILFNVITYMLFVCSTFIITIPVHDIPSACKSYPVLQSHTYEPAVLLHICWHSFNAPSSHSLMSKNKKQ